MDGTPKLASVLKAWPFFVLAIAILGNSSLAAGNSHYAGRKLDDEIPGKYVFKFLSTNISFFLLYF